MKMKQNKGPKDASSTLPFVLKKGRGDVNIFSCGCRKYLFKDTQVITVLLQRGAGALRTVV